MQIASRDGDLFRKNVQVPKTTVQYVVPFLEATWKAGWNMIDKLSSVQNLWLVDDYRG